MKKVKLSELSAAVRNFLEQMLAGDGAVIEDESGTARGQFVPFRDPTPEQEQAADESLAKLRKRADAAMARHGKTEDDLMRVIHSEQFDEIGETYAAQEQAFGKVWDDPVLDEYNVLRQDEPGR